MLKYILPIFVFLIFAPPTVLGASPKGSLEASPAYTEVVIQKSEETKQIVLTYVNNSQKPIALEIFPIDFKQADLTGGISFLGQESGSFSYSLSSFLSFESNELQLMPGEEKDFRVTITNREDLSPGGHYAAVIARLKATDDEVGKARVAPSVSTFILLRKVGGERFNLSITDIDFPSQTMAFNYPSSINATFRNEGNVHLVPYGRVEIKDFLGRMIYKGVINTSSLRVFPESRRYIKIDLERTDWSLPISLNSLTVTGDDSLQKVNYSHNESFIYINPVFLGALVAAISLIVLLKRRIKKK